MLNSSQKISFYNMANCRLADLQKLCEQELDISDFSFATHLESNIPVYDISTLDLVKFKIELMQEWATNLLIGSGIILLKNTYKDIEIIDQVNEVYARILSEEAQRNTTQGDHFAKSGENNRIWNSLEKLCLEAPNLFIDYFSNTAIDMIAESWLGPGYQMTSQLNIVRPGGQSQEPHRDYHLGFMEVEEAEKYPSHIHHFSQMLTLQGGIAHCDMPIASGPTQLLPFSQLYGEGYLAWRREDFRSYFKENYIQLPLKKGDAIFFNPAVFHAAGTNETKAVERIVNLLQISSAMGRPMEKINRKAMQEKVETPLSQSCISMDKKSLVIKNTADGYAFPSNLDENQPDGKLRPKTQQEEMIERLNLSI